MTGGGWLLGWVVLSLVGFALCQEYCLATDNNPYLFFATRTAYEFVYEKRITHQTIPGCRPVQIWMVGRYGTSYPSWERLKTMSDLASFRDQIIHNHESRRNGELCHIDRDALKEWRWNVNLDGAEELTEQGKYDMIYLAKRLKTNFPTVLDNSFTPDRFTFKFSGKEVSRESARQFAQELLGRPLPAEYFTDSNIDHRLSGENCSALGDPEIISKLEFEIEKFKQTTLASGLIHSVSTRLGFLYNLTLDSVLNIYDVCSYEKAWHYSQTSPWCAAFTKRDLMALEYFEDVKQFYQNGYGNSLSLKYGCPLVKDLIQNFQKVADDEGDVPSGRFYFGNEAILEAVMARLGIANDKRQLSASLDSLTGVEKRQWRTAFLSPYAGNIAAVFYKCTAGEANKVMFFINEHTVEYEGCQVGLCSWDYIKERFTPVVSTKCSYDFCDAPTDSASLTTSAVVFVVAMLQVHVVL